MNDIILQQYMGHLKLTISDADHKMVHDGWYENERKIPWNKIYFIESGEGLIIINGVRYSPKPGELLFIPENALQSLQLISPRPYVKYWCHFNAYVGTTPLCDLLDFPLLLTVEEPQVFAETFDALVAAYKSRDGFAPLKASSLLMTLLHHHFTITAKNRIALSHEASTTKLNSLLVFMQSNIHRKLTVNEMAEVMNLHPNYLIRLFKSTFGTSPMDYFNRLKIKEAMEMLSLTTDPINVIADSLGYSSPYYFSNVFKAQTGYTPKDYRVNNRP